METTADQIYSVPGGDHRGARMTEWVTRAVIDANAVPYELQESQHAISLTRAHILKQRRQMLTLRTSFCIIYGAMVSRELSVIL